MRQKCHPYLRPHKVSAQGFNPGNIINDFALKGARAYQVERSGEDENENDKKSGEDPYTDTQRLRVVTV